MSRIITLTTDFGTSDSYVAAMKAVILGIAPDARLVDITHEITPQDVMEGAFVLRQAAAHYPPDTVHLVVIDPGVGTGRRPIALRKGDHYYVGPDNGLFALLFDDDEPDELVHLNRPDFWYAAEPTTTFHGRDIFAPVAAHLAQGRTLADVGSRMSDFKRLHWALPIADDEGVRGWIVHVDRFGNCITNITRKQLSSQHDSRVKGYVGNAILQGIHDTYGSVEPGDPLLLFGSSNHLEIAVNGGNAAQLLSIEKGAQINLLYGNSASKSLRSSSPSKPATTPLVIPPSSRSAGRAGDDAEEPKTVSASLEESEPASSASASGDDDGGRASGYSGGASHSRGRGRVSAATDERRIGSSAGSNDDGTRAAGAPYKTGSRTSAAAASSENSSWSILGGKRLRRLNVALLLIVIAGLVGILIAQIDGPPAGTRGEDLIAVSAEQAEQMELMLQTSRAVEAEDYFTSQYNRRFVAPTLAGARLEGVGIVPFASNLHIPALRYSDTRTGAPITVYAWSYALLDRIQPEANLSTSVMNSLEEAGRLTSREASEKQVVLWRQRDDILMAVAPNEVSSLEARVEL